MVRTVNSKYGAWLATYYDDFASARAIANDDNTPSATVAYDKDKTHFGNPMNGEAILNPRYRWSNNEINKSNGYNTALIGSSDETKELSNNGTFEWLSLDTTRQKASEYEGRAQLQYPDGNVGNKWRFDASGSDAYLLFSNGHDSLGKYIIPLGDDDSTFGAYPNGRVCSASASCWRLDGRNDRIRTQRRRHSRKPTKCISAR
jgi:hypothetical protein